MVAEKIQHIENRIASACKRAGRLREHVTLVAVSKKQPAELVNEALSHGITDLGENRVQEYLAKRDSLQSHRFHMIGHLQRNKVRMLIGKTVLIHSVDSVELAEEIDRRAATAGLITYILLEVNSSGEESKFGLSLSEVPDVAGRLQACRNVRLRGLMTVAEYLEDVEQLRPSFRSLRVLRDELAARFQDVPITELSMGMTNDFEVAIEEGATMVRIGSAIFGPRE